MEISLHNAIGAALGIERTKLWILTANLRFRDKTNILRTLIDVSVLNDDEKQCAKLKLRKLGNHAGRRNMIAHDPFQADPDGDGVSFITIKAKGNFDIPTVVWSAHQFDEEDRALGGYATLLEHLEERFKATPLTHQNYVAALRPFLDMNESYRDTPLPMRHMMSPGSADHLSPPAPERPDSDQNKPQMPGEPEPKP